jgi:hypothetical protein
MTVQKPAPSSTSGSNHHDMQRLRCKTVQSFLEQAYCVMLMQVTCAASQPGCKASQTCDFLGTLDDFTRELPLTSHPARHFLFLKRVLALSMERNPDHVTSTHAFGACAVFGAWGSCLSPHVPFTPQLQGFGGCVCRVGGYWCGFPIDIPGAELAENNRLFGCRTVRVITALAHVHACE